MIFVFTLLLNKLEHLVKNFLENIIKNASAGSIGNYGYSSACAQYRRSVIVIGKSKYIHTQQLQQCTAQIIQHNTNINANEYAHIEKTIRQYEYILPPFKAPHEEVHWSSNTY